MSGRKNGAAKKRKEKDAIEKAGIVKTVLPGFEPQSPDDEVDNDLLGNGLVGSEFELSLEMENAGITIKTSGVTYAREALVILERIMGKCA